jgi:lipopolysaccharide biosynthesis protein
LKKIRPIAIYLPQFHPIPENDEWWGKGFTEWTNVVRAKPVFKGHHQPHLPADLGFYDLRLAAARKAQADLAKEYGIYGFCYYHYWFNGKRLLHEPLDDMLRTGIPDFPFIYCWANENWTRRWDGNENQALIRQQYSHDDDREHIQWLCKEVFRDPRYIRVGGRPFFAIYRPSLFPNISETIRIWRHEAMELGIGELYLGYMQGFNMRVEPEKMGFDVAIDFQPDFFDSPKPLSGNIINKIMGRLKNGYSIYHVNRIIPYENFLNHQLSKPTPSYKQFPSITPSWDNSPRRRKDMFILKDATPSLYEQWLTHLIRKYEPYSEEENFIFINAWNEWAEGNHLEPCTKWGKAWLEATKRAVGNEQ